MADRDAELVALRAARLATGDEQIAAEHAAKQAEIARIDAEVADEGPHRAPTTDAPTASAGTRRVVLVGHRIARPIQRFGHLVSLVGPAIRYSGGLRGALRRAVGLIRREGLSGIRYGVQVADQLRVLATELALEEIVINTWAHDPAVRGHSYALLAREFALGSGRAA